MSLVPLQKSRVDSRKRGGATKVHAAYSFAAPMRGVDLTQPLAGGDPMTAIRMENMLPATAGVALRGGYQRWVSNLGAEVRTLMSYHPADAGQQLFAATGGGDVFDVTSPLASTVTPMPVLDITGGTREGECSSTNFTTDAGIHVMAMVCNGAGYWVYNGTVWTKITQGTGADQIEGVNPALFSFVLPWKGRLWFIEQDSTRLWYLPGGVYFGAATSFDVGPFLPMGGKVAGLANWTIDSGQGLNDQLVIISDEGDVLIYEGTDPDVAADFRQVGRWNIGKVPKGSRFFGQYGSDVAIVCERGLAFVTEIMRGQGFFAEPQAAKAINTAVAEQFQERGDAYYWEVRFLPSEQLVVINVPTLAQGSETQWAYEVNDQAFSTLTGMPMNTVLGFDSGVYFGDLLGNVWRAFEGDSDGSIDGVPGRDIEGRIATAFQPLGDPVQIKRFLMVRPSFLSGQIPGYSVQLNSEWNVVMPTDPPVFSSGGGSVWGAAVWGESTWSGATQSYEQWRGATGVGRFGSLAIRIRGPAKTTFIGWHAVVEPGGVL